MRPKQAMLGCVATEEMVGVCGLVGCSRCLSLAALQGKQATDRRPNNSLAPVSIDRSIDRSHTLHPPTTHNRRAATQREREVARQQAGAMADAIKSAVTFAASNLTKPVRASRAIDLDRSDRVCLPLSVRLSRGQPPRHPCPLCRLRLRGVRPCVRGVGLVMCVWGLWAVAGWGLDHHPTYGSGVGPPPVCVCGKGVCL